jgi:hypothetical protein
VSAALFGAATTLKEFVMSIRIRRLAATALAATALTFLTLGVTSLIAPSAQAAAPGTGAGTLKLTPSIPIPPPRPTRR